MLLNWRSKGLAFNELNIPPDDPKMKLAIAIASKLAKPAHLNKYQDDFLSIAFVQLYELINESSQLDEKEFLRVLINRISSRCFTFVKTERRQNCYNSSGIKHKLVTRQAGVEKENEEYAKSFAETDLEKVVIDLRLQGYTDQEIADMSGSLSHDSVSRIRYLLQCRYLLAERRNEST